MAAETVPSTLGSILSTTIWRSSTRTRLSGKECHARKSHQEIQARAGRLHQGRARSRRPDSHGSTDGDDRKPQSGDVDELAK